MPSSNSDAPKRARKKTIVQNQTEPEKEFKPTEIQNEQDLMFKNGLGDALGLGSNIEGFNVGGFGNQLSQVNTLFKNNRWYLISNMRQLLSQIYVEHGLVQTIVDVPVDDGMRGGIEVKTDQISEDQLADLIAAIEEADDIGAFSQANKWNRLFGGAGVVIITNQDPSTELDINAIKQGDPLHFKAVDMWELFYDKQNITDTDATEIDPEIHSDKFEHYNYYGKKLHRSRVLVLKGLTAPSFVRPRLRGWGFSVVETLVRSINQYLKSNDLSFEVLDEFKLDVYKLKNLANTLIQKDGEAKVRQRVQLANQQKNYQHAVVMDSEDEFDHKQLSFSGLAETMVGIRMQIASDMRMPLTKVFGISAAGFSSGEDDIENYNAMVEGQVRAKAKFHILKMVKLRCQTMFGSIPDDLKIGFKPLRILSAEQEENVKTQKFNRLLQAKTSGELTTKEFRDGCNKDNLLSIQLSTDVDELSLDEGGEDEENDAETEPKESGKAPKSTIQAKEAKPAKNSMEYDRAAFEADGGDEQYSLWHKRRFEFPEVSKELFDQAKSESQAAFGEVRWQFVLWVLDRKAGKK